MLFDLLYLPIVHSPNDTVALGVCHINELLKVFINIPLVSGRVKYLNLQGYKVISERLQYDKHNAPHNHFVHVIRIFNPYILKTNYILPTPLDP
jgi:hypothetical protein